MTLDLDWGCEGGYWLDESGGPLAVPRCLAEWFEVPEGCTRAAFVFSKREVEGAYQFRPHPHQWAGQYQLQLADGEWGMPELGFDWELAWQFGRAWKKGYQWIGLEVEP